MALLPDGRLVVPDAMNGRAQLLGPGPGEREEWPLHDFHPYGTHRIWTDDAGRTWILHLAMPATDWDAMLRGVVIVRGPDGTHVDTLPGPAGDFDSPELTASSKPRGPTGATGHRTEPVPFSPAAEWAGYPHGPTTTRRSAKGFVRCLRAGRTYLGAVDAPVEFKASVNPVFDGDHVWAVTRDEVDVQRVVRYRIVR